MIKAVIFDCFGVLVDVISNRQYDEVIKYVAHLRRHYKTAMVSNVSGRATLDRLFDDGQLDELFDLVVPSGDVGYEKPQAEIFQLTAEKLGVKPKECLFIDDIQRFCDAAADVGMQTVTFYDRHASLGDIKKALGETSADQN